jgi:hypothetical protein
MARTFNGTSDKITVANTSTLGITVGAWFKTTSASAAACIIDSDTGAAGGRNFQFRIGSGKLQAITFTGATPVTTTGVTTINGGGWFHGAITIPTSGVVTVWVNGVSDKTSASAGWNVSAGTGTWFGTHNNGASQFFAGTIAEAFIFNSAVLTANQLAALAAGMPVSHLGPSHYWPLWGGDSPEPDLGTATHSNGTLTGTTAANGPPVSTSLLDLG